MGSSIGQTAVYVDDLEAAIRDFTEVFGMEFRVSHAEFLNMMVAQSDNGLVLCSKADPSQGSAVETIWNKPLLAMEIKVDDIEESRAALEAKGVKAIYYLEAAAGMKEYYTDRFHGIPLTIFQMESESWLEATMGEGDEPNITVEWVNRPEG
jgi:catechol 2,3-dioxygenase-like lactoylglutathione lyase family enzyme